MNRIRLAVVIAVALVALGVGVAVVATQDSSPNGATAATTTSATDTVSVSGTGTVQGQPDTLVANFRVHALAAAVQTALNTSASDARKVIAIVPDADLSVVMKSEGSRIAKNEGATCRRDRQKPSSSRPCSRRMVSTAPR